MIEFTYKGKVVYTLEAMADLSTKASYESIIVGFKISETEMAHRVLNGGELEAVVLALIYRAKYGQETNIMALDELIDDNVMNRISEVEKGLDELYSELGSWPKVCEWFGLLPTVGGVRNIKNWKKGKKNMPEKHFNKMRDHLNK